VPGPSASIYWYLRARKAVTARRNPEWNSHVSRWANVSRDFSTLLLRELCGHYSELYETKLGEGSQGSRIQALFFLSVATQKASTSLGFERSPIFISSGFSCFVTSTFHSKPFPSNPDTPAASCQSAYIVAGEWQYVSSSSFTTGISSASPAVASCNPNVTLPSTGATSRQIASAISRCLGRPKR